MSRIPHSVHPSQIEFIGKLRNPAPIFRAYVPEWDARPEDDVPGDQWPALNAPEPAKPPEIPSPDDDGTRLTLAELVLVEVHRLQDRGEPGNLMAERLYDLFREITITQAKDVATHRDRLEVLERDYS